ncbi:hypothetical protein J2S49_001339 [Arcanobacterium wilhelmae]|uniref:Sulphur transport domain-containing protein n=1 Tax=Arcanobacterium wilhelmae TaxID=1803177 RepID=A0ABT9NC18_9ACTO|nr:hypothetical protein [Arcanobacterium wilhelmae]MDP9801263.1 hypothetical protein [Arcanobacterium wilhelmae]WFN90608.1 hypothetical protein P8A24_01760 [Arcanobacterium wilhelmae]
MHHFSFAWVGIKSWSARAWLVAAAGALGTALLIGFATVLIPNSVFGRDIAPVAWNYPVWIATAVLTGLLLGTYVGTPAGDVGAQPSTDRGSLGLLGTALGWFAVGCPVCNKIALLALGYSGAISYFAPLQPLLAVAALGLLVYALIRRLSGQVACTVAIPSVRE